MKLANYISDLLYRYECVIVPNFGGFVTNNKSAKINNFNHTFYPPYKQITFNSRLKENDGLLANYISSVDNISYQSAVNYIKFEVEAWFTKLDKQTLELDKVGTITLLNDKLIFDPESRNDYLTSSFGLSSFSGREIKREVYVKEVQKLEEKAPILISSERKKAPNYFKYAAIFVLGFSVLGLGGKFYKDHQNKQTIIAAQKQQKELDTKIESATFVISKPLPALNMEVAEAKKDFHVIAGAFRIPENADRKLSQLQSEGFEDARILGVNKWGLTVVSYGSYDTRDESYQVLHKIKEERNKESWLLVQKF
ncbi:MAG: SPOR domain-containing protein [Bacteroidota bacterium]